MENLTDDDDIAAAYRVAELVLNQDDTIAIAAVEVLKRKGYMVHRQIHTRTAIA